MYVYTLHKINENHKKKKVVYFSPIDHTFVIIQITKKRKTEPKFILKLLNLIYMN